MSKVVIDDERWRGRPGVADDAGTAARMAARVARVADKTLPTKVHEIIGQTTSTDITASSSTSTPSTFRRIPSTSTAHSQFHRLDWVSLCHHVPPGNPRRPPLCRALSSSSERAKVPEHRTAHRKVQELEKLSPTLGCCHWRRVLLQHEQCLCGPARV